MDGTIPQLTDDGVTMTAGAYRPTDVCDAGIADKLGIPAAYLKEMRGSRLPSSRVIALAGNPGQFSDKSFLHLLAAGLNGVVGYDGLTANGMPDGVAAF
jgi:hypothetical protein